MTIETFYRNSAIETCSKFLSEHLSKQFLSKPIGNPIEPWDWEVLRETATYLCWISQVSNMSKQSEAWIISRNLLTKTGRLMCDVKLANVKWSTSTARQTWFRILEMPTISKFTLCHLKEAKLSVVLSLLNQGNPSRMAKTTILMPLHRPLIQNQHQQSRKNRR